MKYTLEIPDEDAAFVLKVISRMSSAAKVMPVPARKGRTATKVARLQESIEQLNGGEGTVKVIPTVSTQ